MNKFSTFLFILCLSAINCLASDIEGWWSMNVAEIPTVIHITKSQTGLNGTLYSPTQTSDSIKIESVIQRGDSLFLSVPTLNAKFAGLIKEKQIIGQFSQNGFSLKATMKATTANSIALEKPQTPKAPFHYNTQEVVINCDSVILSGTLTKPYDNRPAGGVVFISGSGSQDRDETIKGHKPFAVIADFLTKAGWTTLRCDDRGVGGSSTANGTEKASYFDLADDVISQINYLRSLPELKGKPIGVIGHSQGGNIAFITASEHPELINFIVALATPGIKGSEVIMAQNEMIAGNSMTATYRNALRSMFNILASEKTADEIRDEVTQLASLLAPPSAIKNLVDVSLSETYRELLRHDPKTYMSQVKCPVYAAVGTHDMQVESERNLTAIANAIPQAVTQEYKGLNHLLQHCPSPTLNYGQIQETISPKVLADILTFLLDVKAN